MDRLPINQGTKLQAPCADGTTQPILELLDFVSRLAPLVSTPWVNSTCYHCVFAPKSQHQALVTPVRRGRAHRATAVGPEAAIQADRRAAMSWAQRLKRGFSIEIEICSVCCGSIKVLACIDDPLVINQILRKANTIHFLSINFDLAIARQKHAMYPTPLRRCISSRKSMPRPIIAPVIFHFHL